MSKTEIVGVIGRQVLDSRGNPTVEAEGVKKGACQLRQTPFEGGEGENQNFRNQVEM